jgi:hypothetical protein
MTNEQNDWRALCVELITAIRRHADCMTLDDEVHDVLDRIRAALAQPEPQRPTVMEIVALADEVEEEGLGQVDLVRRALTRWGRPSTEPVPVAEQPWEREGWCDAEGRCWWGRPSEELCNSDWFLATRAEVEEFCDDCLPVVSLPHHALPLPQQPS